MLNFLWRLFVAAFCYVVFIYIAPLFLAVIDITPDADFWALTKALAAVGALAYAIWGRHTYPWGPPP